MLVDGITYGWCLLRQRSKMGDPSQGMDGGLFCPHPTDIEMTWIVEDEVLANENLVNASWVRELTWSGKDWGKAFDSMPWLIIVKGEEGDAIGGKDEPLVEQ